MCSRVISRVRLVAAAATVLTATVLIAPAGSTTRPATTVIALVGEAGIEVLHKEFATADGRDVPLPPAAAAQAVRVNLPDRRLDHDQRREIMLRGPLGKPKPYTLYYLRGTRVLIWTGLPKDRAALTGVEVSHGTGTGSLAAGLTTGTAPKSLLVVTLDYTDPSWAWVASQPWIDIASSSVFDLIGAAAPVV